MMFLIYIMGSVLTVLVMTSYYKYIDKKKRCKEKYADLMLIIWLTSIFSWIGLICFIIARLLKYVFNNGLDTMMKDINNKLIEYMFNKN